MKTSKILQKYIEFQQKNGHKLIPNVSLVPENDPTLLFVNSGVFPLVPYLFGQPHPLGKRLVNVQRCLRFEDLEEVGTSNRHTTAFHMIGNWSLGDYFKKEQLNWKFEFFVEELGLDINKIYATVFSGNDDAPKDQEAIDILKDVYKKYGIEAKEGERIFETPKDNWWQRGEAIGEPGGPSSELFYYIGSEGDGFGQNILQNEEEFIELGNSVFMQYTLTEEGWKPLPQKSIDFGGGLERIALAVQGKQDIFETDNFYPIIQKIEEISGVSYLEEKNKRQMRVLADHLRACTFLAMDGVKPSNKDQGYVLRRLLRLMVRAGSKLGIPVGNDLSASLVPTVAEMFVEMYPQILQNQTEIIETFSQEEKRFEKILSNGAKKVDGALDKFEGSEEDLAKLAFDFFQSLGYPIEIFISDVQEKFGNKYNLEKVENLYIEQFEEHKQQSREGAEQKFKGGLADQSEQTIKYHTTTHLLHWALREVLGEGVQQKGSNITGERLRFDFSYGQKLTQEQLEKVDELINSKVGQDIPVNSQVLSKTEAEQLGALHFFGEKYGDEVTVYYLGDTIEEAFSKEFCGGPHVNNLNKLDPIEIYKQKSIGEGLVRVYLRKK